MSTRSIAYVLMDVTGMYDSQGKIHPAWVPRFFNSNNSHGVTDLAKAQRFSRRVDNMPLHWAAVPEHVAAAYAAGVSERAPAKREAPKGTYGIGAGYTVEVFDDKTAIVSEEGHRFEFSPEVTTWAVHIVADAHKAGLEAASRPTPAEDRAEAGRFARQIGEIARIIDGAKPDGSDALTLLDVPVLTRLEDVDFTALAALLRRLATPAH